MFDIDQLVADCRAALKEDASQAAVREVVAVFYAGESPAATRSQITSRFRIHLLAPDDARARR